MLNVTTGCTHELLVSSWKNLLAVAESGCTHEFLVSSWEKKNSSAVWDKTGCMFFKK